jgi:hypothetical protein
MAARAFESGRYTAGGAAWDMLRRRAARSAQREYSRTRAPNQRLQIDTAAPDMTNTSTRFESAQSDFRSLSLSDHHAVRRRSTFPPSSIPSVRLGQLGMKGPYGSRRSDKGKGHSAEEWVWPLPFDSWLLPHETLPPCSYRSSAPLALPILHSVHADLFKPFP